MPEPRRWTMQRVFVAFDGWRNFITGGPAIEEGPGIEVVESSALDAAQARIAELERDLAVAQEATAACGESGCEWARRAESAEAALAAQAWVPCSERMPDPGQLVMVSIAEYSAIDRTLRTCVRLDVRKPTRGWQSESPVVAWRPLPAPWEGDEPRKPFYYPW